MATAPEKALIGALVEVKNRALRPYQCRSAPLPDAAGISGRSRASGARKILKWGRDQGGCKFKWGHDTRDREVLERDHTMEWRLLK